MSYRYTRLTRSIPNSAHDKRRRHGIDAVAEFKEGSLWHILEGGTENGLLTHGRDVLYRGRNVSGGGSGYVGFMHPDYESLLAAMEDREPTNCEVVEEMGLAPDDVLDAIDAAAVKLAAESMAPHA